MHDNNTYSFGISLIRISASPYAQLSITNGSLASGGTLCPFPIHVKILLGLRLYRSFLCVLSHLLWVHLCSCPVESRRHCCLVIIHTLWFLFFFSLLSSAISPEPWDMDCDRDVTFKTWNSIVSYFINFYQLLVSVLITVFCK